MEAALGDDYPLLFASNGIEALAGVALLNLLDVQMPDLNGYNLRRQLNAARRTEAIPVILSSLGMEVDYVLEMAEDRHLETPGSRSAQSRRGPLNHGILAKQIQPSCGKLVALKRPLGATALGVLAEKGRNSECRQPVHH
jgi:CheY-like chemotaxis protein